MRNAVQPPHLVPEQETLYLLSVTPHLPSLPVSGDH